MSAFTRSKLTIVFANENMNKLSSRSKLERASDVAFRAVIYSFLFLVIMAIVLGVFGALTQNSSASFKAVTMSIVTPINLLVVLVFGLGAVILWVSALMWIIKTWRDREEIMSLAYLAFLIVGSVLAGIVFYVIKKRNEAP